MFTSAVTLLQALTSALAVLDMNSGSFFPAYCLSMVTWVIISQSLLLTFDRVIRHHEKEAVLQNPGFWEPARREVREVFRVPTARGHNLFDEGSLSFLDNVVDRNANAASSVTSDPFRSRRSSRSSRIRPGPYPECELPSRPDPIRGAPASLSRRSTVASSTRPLPRQSMSNGYFFFFFGL